MNPKLIDWPVFDTSAPTADLAPGRAEDVTASVTGSQAQPYRADGAIVPPTRPVLDGRW